MGLEFASLFATLGTEVTVFDAGKRLLPREEQDIATLAQEYLQAKNINFVFNANLTQVRNEGETVVITDNSQDYSFDAVLYATGRKPNVSSLNLEATDIKLTEKGAIQVNEYCETTVPNVFAVGDVNGGPQFTYISLDDFRIVLTI
nr:MULTISPECIES: FAD-dependent oxidoreductase [Pelistega]